MSNRGTLEEHSRAPKRKRTIQEDEDSEEPSSKKARTSTETVEEAIEDEEMESDEEDFSKSNSISAMEEKIILALKVNPDDAEAREMAKILIRKKYISNGGLPFNKNDPVPHDLEKLTSVEMIHVLENIQIHEKRSAQGDLINRATSGGSNVVYLLTGDKQVIGQVNSDNVLRKALVDVFLGTRFSPLLSLIISVFYHITNLLVSYKDNGQRTSTSTSGERKTAESKQSEQSSSSAHPFPQPYNSGFEDPNKRKNS